MKLFLQTFKRFIKKKKDLWKGVTFGDNKILALAVKAHTGRKPGFVFVVVGHK